MHWLHSAGLPLITKNKILIIVTFKCGMLLVCNFLVYNVTSKGMFIHTGWFNTVGRACKYLSMKKPKEIGEDHISTDSIYF